MAIDAFGAAIGCLGLALFAATAWKMLPHGPLWLALALATLVWAISAVTGWFAQRHLLRQRS